jgi:hypothetical protein
VKNENFAGMMAAYELRRTLGLVSTWREKFPLKKFSLAKRQPWPGNILAGIARLRVYNVP